MAGTHRILALVAALTTLAIAAPAASAGPLVTSAQSCEAQQFSKPFAPWLDHANYTPVPGGSFEAGEPAWTLTGGAKVVAGNERFHVRSASDSQSLYIPRGGTATSPAMCVGLAEPTLRYFAKSGLLGSMTVEVLTETSLGAVVAVPIGAAALSASWNPSLPHTIVANLLPLLPDDKTAVAFRFRAVTGNWYVDDAYVDPYVKR